MLKYLLIIFQKFDLEQIKELLKKYLILLQNYLTVKKNEEENFKKLKEEIIFLIGIINDSINACEYLLPLFFILIKKLFKMYYNNKIIKSIIW